MSFTKTVSVFAALASIFAAGATGWKLAQDGQTEKPVYEQTIEELKKEISTLKEQATTVDPPTPVALPPTPQMSVNTQSAPKPSVLPPPPPPVVSSEL